MNSYHAVFISPHLDDAALSCGGKIAQYTRRHKSVLVVTVFTKGSSGDYSSDGRKFLTQAGERSAAVLFQKRSREDDNALRTLGADALRLGLTDALFRNAPSFYGFHLGQKQLYPTFRHVFSGHINKQDKNTLDILAEKLSSLKRTYVKKNTRVFAPFGVGGHVDHLLTFIASYAIFKKQLTWWDDIPYRTNDYNRLQRKLTVQQYVGPMNEYVLNIRNYATLKMTCIAKYHSQLSGLQKNGLQPIDYFYERYYKI